MKLANVMFPTDFSAVAEVALRVAVDVARASGARLHVVHVVPPVTDPGDAAGGLERLRATLSREVPVDVALLSGRVAHHIAAYARDKSIDLIVVGTHGRTGFSRAILGSVAEAVLRHAPCLVLTVPPAALEPRPAEAAAAEGAATRACIVCGLPTDDLACERCRGRIRAEALEQKLKAERPGHHSEGGVATR